jgi:CelD/BcsL family acetyltransferase involved in cellulose biosynthesis
MSAPAATGQRPLPVRFDYVETPCTLPPRLTLERGAAPPGRIVRYVEESVSLVLDVPDRLEDLHELRNGRFWKDARRRARRFEESHGPLSFRAMSDPEALAEVLPSVRSLFSERWDGQFTSLRWDREADFQPYATAMIELARSGGAELVLAEGDGRLLAFNWLLMDPPWSYCWQHAMTRVDPYPAFGVGTLLDIWTFEYLITRGDIAHYDFMVGDGDYKRGWESWRRPVYLKLEEPDSITGRVRLAGRAGLHRTRLLLRDDHPRIYEGIKHLLGRLERLLIPEH